VATIVDRPHHIAQPHFSELRSQLLEWLAIDSSPRLTQIAYSTALKRSTACRSNSLE
jgi:hypothetical protein